MDLTVKNNQLKKHVATVHITNEDLGLLARKIYSVLVYNAFPFLRKRGRGMHSLPIAELRERIGWTQRGEDGHEISLTNNNKAIKEAVQFLQTTLIETNHTDRHWSSVQFLGRSEIRDGIIHYSFDEWVAEQLGNPDVYARINIGVIGLIRESRYSLALYENCARYRPNRAKGFVGEVTWTLEEFRQIMGVASKDSYKTYKDLKRRVLNPALKEVNSLSDLAITAKPVKQGKNYVAIKFSISDNPQLALDLLPSVEDAGRYGDHPLLGRLGRLGVSTVDALKHLGTYGEDRCLEVVEWTEGKCARGEVKNASGFIARALVENWARPKDAKVVNLEMKAERRKVEVKRAAESARRREKKSQEVAEQEAYRAYLEQEAFARLKSYGQAEQRELVRAWLVDHGSLWRERFPDPLAALEEGGMVRASLGHHLVALWQLEESCSLEKWRGRAD